MSQHKKPTKASPIVKLDTGERGRSGLVHSSGIISEEDLRQLRTPEQRRKIYKEMRYDPTCAAVLFAITMLIRQVEWTARPASEDPDDIEAAKFVDECMDDLNTSWQDLISEVVSFTYEGWAYFEIVYKTRDGQHNDPSKRSKFSDGRIGWRKMALRGQDTLTRWEFDDEGGIAGMVQNPAPDYIERTVPIEKSLLFRTSTYKGNPEGESIFRAAYLPWYFKKRIQQYEAIGMERDLAGFPVLTVPAEWTDASAASDLKAAYTDAQKLVTNIKRDEQEGVVLPAIFDDKGNQELKLELLSSGGKRNFDTDKIVARYDLAIARTVLADFLFLGAGKTGSFALSSDKTDLFATAIGAWTKMMADVFNRHAIPRLFALNGWSLEKLPTIEPGDIESPDLAALGEYISKLSGVNIDLTDTATQDYLRTAGGLPPTTDEDDVPDVDPDPDTQEGMIEAVEAVKSLADDIRKSLG